MSADPRADVAAPAAPTPPTRRRVQSVELFGQARELIIEHRAQEYRLSITRAGKLILTK